LLACCSLFKLRDNMRPRRRCRRPRYPRCVRPSTRRVGKCVWSDRPVCGHFNNCACAREEDATQSQVHYRCQGVWPSCWRLIYAISMTRSSGKQSQCRGLRHLWRCLVGGGGLHRLPATVCQHIIVVVCGDLCCFVVWLLFVCCALQEPSFDPSSSSATATTWCHALDVQQQLQFEEEWQRQCANKFAATTAWPASVKASVALCCVCVFVCFPPLRPWRSACGVPRAVVGALFLFSPFSARGGLPLWLSLICLICLCSPCTGLWCVRGVCVAGLCIQARLFCPLPK